MEDFKKYPNMLRQYIRNAKVYFDTHPNIAAHKWAANIYEWVFAEMLFARHSDYMDKFKNTLFPPEESWYKNRLEEMFKVDLTI